MMIGGVADPYYGEILLVSRDTSVEQSPRTWHPHRLMFRHTVAPRRSRSDRRQQTPAARVAGAE